MIDYIEQTSLKFHIDRFFNLNENETYIFQQYIINFKQNDSCFYIYIKNNLLPTNKNLSAFVIEKKSYNFELFLHLLEHTIKTSQEETNETTFFEQYKNEKK